MFGQVLASMVAVYAIVLLAYHGYCRRQDRQRLDGRRAYPPVATAPERKDPRARSADRDLVLLTES